MVDKAKAFLTKQGPFGLPVYAYLAGAIALVGGIWYFKTHNTGAATATPQTNYPAAGSPLPYPDPGSGAAGAPPSSAFDLPMAGSSVPQYTSQANFVPPAPQPTSSQGFAAAVQTPYQSANYNPVYVASAASQPSYSSQSLGVSSALSRVPIIGRIASALAGTPASPGGASGFNPVLPRSSGTRAV